MKTLSLKIQVLASLMCTPPPQKSSNPFSTAVFVELISADRYAPCGPWDFMEVFSLYKKKRRFSVSLVGGQVDLEMRPRSILEEKKDTGLN